MDILPHKVRLNDNLYGSTLERKGCLRERENLMILNGKLSKKFYCGISNDQITQVKRRK